MCGYMSVPEDGRTCSTCCPLMRIGKVWICRLLFVILFFLLVRLRISPARIKLAASNFPRRFIGVPIKFARAACARRIGMCGCTLKTDVLINIIIMTLVLNSHAIKIVLCTGKDELEWSLLLLLNKTVV